MRSLALSFFVCDVLDFYLPFPRFQEGFNFGYMSLIPILMTTWRPNLLVLRNQKIMKNIVVWLESLPTYWESICSIFGKQGSCGHFWVCCRFWKQLGGICSFFVCFLWSSNWQLSFIIFSTLNYWEWNFYWEVKFCCFCKTQTEKCKLVCSGWYYSSFARYIEIFGARIWSTWENILRFYQFLFVKCTLGFIEWCLCWSECWHLEMLGRF